MVKTLKLFNLKLGVLAGLFCFVVSCTFAQQYNSEIGDIFINSKRHMVGDRPVPQRLDKIKKTRAVPFWTDNFGLVTGSGSAILPIGWTALALSGNGTWRWTNTAASGAYGIGALASPTTLNGWMIYDCDSIASISALTTTGPAGDLISPVIDCSTHPSVKCSFYESFRKFSDSCFLMVSPDSGSTWVKYQIPDRANMSTNSGNNNPTFHSINISTTAAGSSKVLIKFSYKCSSPGGAFNWLVDDVALSELDPVDMTINELALFFEQGVGGNTVIGTFSRMPQNFNTPFVVNYKYTNNGFNTVNNQTIDAKSVRISNGNVFNNQTYSFNNLMANSPVQNGFLASPISAPSNALSYTHVNIAIAGDANPTDNVDTLFYGISDTTYNHIGTTLGGDFVINRPAGVLQALKQMGGNLFVVPDGKSDTLTSVRAYFTTNTDVGAKVLVEVYKVGVPVSAASSYSLISKSDVYTLTAANISSATQLRSAVISIPYNNVPQSPILTAGRYLVLLRTIGEASDQIEIYTSDKPNNSVLLSIADSDEGQLMGAAPFNPFTITGAVPLIELGFARKTETSSALLGIDQIQNNGFEIYPNPAEAAIVVTQPNKFDKATLVVKNVLGAVVASTPIHKSTTIDIQGLNSGTYFITLTDANGNAQTKSFVKK
jgi:hypothetical protein